MKQEFPLSIFLIAFAAYTLMLFLVSWITARKAGSNSFFSGDRKAPWYLVAYGMVGASVSGVTFVSLPGNVLSQNFYYLPLVFGFAGGYLVIAKVLLPLYFKMNITSIYAYLGERFGEKSHKTGTVVFMISRILGAAVRVFVVVLVLYAFLPKGILGNSDIFGFTVITAIFMLLLFLYTVKGGVKTIIWTDVLQTTFMLLAVFLTIFFVCKQMGWNLAEMWTSVMSAPNPEIAGTKFSDALNWDWGASTNVIKQFIAGVFVTIAMTGLDQSMMQKSLACKNIKDAQKNVYTTTIIIIVVNMFFLILGAILSIYVAKQGGFDALGITKTDQMFPTVASQYLGIGVGVLFLIGLISASYPSAGGAMTALTTSFCVDFLGFNTTSKLSDKRKNSIRSWVHAAFALLFVLIIVGLYVWSNDAVINLVYALAAYTYGPLLGIFFFGILTKLKVKDGATPYIAAAAPILCFFINFFGKKYFDFDLGFSLLIVNGLLTFIGMWLFRKK